MLDSEEFFAILIQLNKSKGIRMNKEDEERLISIEMAVANQERVIEDLNQVVIEQGKIIDRLQKQCEYLLLQLENETVKPLNEETPPPHY